MAGARKKFAFGFVPELDGVRGISIWVVMAYHAGVPLLKGGFVGVDVFFVLSGFLITALLLREHEKAGRISLKHFYLRRVLRLAPALLLLLLVFSAASVAFLSPAEARSNLIDAGIVLFYAANWARAFHIHPPNYLGHAWSLSVEEQFYILWPCTLILLLRWVRSRGAVLSIVLGLGASSWLLRCYYTWLGSGVYRLTNGSDVHADGLLIGCALSMAMSWDFLPVELSTAARKTMRYLGPLAGLGTVAIAVSTNLKSHQVYYWQLLAVELMTAVIIYHVFATEKGGLRSLLALPLLAWTGKISYGLYLWHVPVFKTMSDNGMRGAVAKLAGVGITFVIASASFYLMECKFLQLRFKLAPETAPNRLLQSSEGPSGAAVAP